MNLKLLQLAALLPGLFLAACSGSSSEAAAPLILPSDNDGVGEVTASQPGAKLETLVDEQGQISVAVTPLNLSAATTTLDFEVVLDTHSVDLSMDLTTLATLTTDNGHQVTATLWDAPQGGHHVAGVLSFPATIDGISLLDHASRLTVTIGNVDAPERAFTWDLSES
jgi:hypothetical protein